MFLSRYIKKNFLLLISLTGIISLLSCGISYIITFANENNENNYYFNNSTYSLVFSENISNQTDFYKKIIDFVNKEKNINLFNTNMTSYFGTSQGIYLNSPLKITPRMKEGRFFNTEDFKDNNKKLAIVGVSLVNNIKIKNNIKTINFNGSDYEIIGIMGDDNYSKEMNYKIIFNLNSLIDTKSNIKNNNWVISSDTNLDTAIKNLRIHLENLEFVSSKTEKVSNPILSVLKNHSNSIFYDLTIFTSILVNVFIVIFFWFDGFIKEIGVRKSFGANNKNIYLYLFKKFVINNMVATFASITLLLILQKFSLISAHYNFYTINIIYISLFILIFSIILLSILIKRINNIKPNYILRGVK